MALKLKGRASAWWEQLRLTRERRGKPKICDWEKMKKKLREFLAFQLFTKHVSAVARSVDEYTEEFHQLVARNDLMETEEQLVARYISGLRLNIRDELEQRTIWTVSEAYQRALGVKRKQARGRSHFSSTMDRPSAKARSGDQVVRSQGSNVHYHASQPGSSNNSGNSQGDRSSAAAGSFNQGQHQSTQFGNKCYECGETGHKSAACRRDKAKQLMMGAENAEQYADPEEDPTYDEGDEANDAEELVYGDVGESLVIQKSLLLPKEEVKSDWLRNNTFHTTCTVSGKICKLIIDSGSCENVISREAVEKLQLKQEKHPRPY